jgi:hypothetical protein
MTQTVSRPTAPNIGDYRYIFLVVEWQDYVHPVTEELDKQAHAFGADLRGEGVVVRAFHSRSLPYYEEVKAKPWPTDILERMDTESAPFMVIISKSFGVFSPDEDEWAIIWFSDFDDEPAQIRRLFATLAAKTRRGENVIAYLQQIVVNERAKEQVSRFAKLASYFEIKPQLFGVSIDVTAILRDISTAGRA